MRTTRSTGYIAVTLTIALLAFEAVAALGLARVASSWTPPRVAALARAAATTWSALARSTQRTLVTWTLPAALGAVRTASDVMRTAYLLWPAADGAPQAAPARPVEVIAIVQTPVPNVAVHVCPSQKASTRIVCSKVTSSRVVYTKVTTHSGCRSRSRSSS